MYDNPIGPSFCNCLRCVRKNNYPGYPSQYDVFDYQGSYQYHGTRKWIPQGAGNTFYGMELELNFSDSSPWRTAVSHLGNVIAEVKPDCGLMEMTTHPMSFPFFMGHYPWGMLKELEDSGARAQPYSGGIHIHVNKTAFDDANHIFNWWHLYYDNPSYMKILGGRESDHFDNSPRTSDMRTLAEQVAEDILRDKVIHRCAIRALIRKRGLFIREQDKIELENASSLRTHSYNFSGMGQAIAVDRNPDSFEVRFPGASLNPQEVKSRVQLIAAGVEFTRHNDNTEFGAFRGWVFSRPQYAELAASIRQL